MTSLTPLCFVILVHQGSKQVAGLLKYIYNQEDFFVIHVDRSAPEAFRLTVEGLVKGLSNVHVLSSRVCSWGSVSIVDATVDCLDLALNVDTHWNHAVLLSGSHLPLKSRDELLGSLYPGKSYMTWDILPPDDNDTWMKGVSARVDWSYLEIEGKGMLRGDPIARPTFPYYKGSQWSVLAREHVDYVLRNAGSSTALRLRRTNVLDESYFQTLLLNSIHRRACCNKSLTYSNWSGGASPDFVNLETIIKKIDDKNFFFVRKISGQLHDVPQLAALMSEVRRRPLDPRLAENLALLTFD